MLKEKAAWLRDAFLNLITPISVPPLDMEKLKGLAATDELELRRIDLYGKLSVRILLLLSVSLAFFLIWPSDYATVQYLFVAFLVAPILVLGCVTVWFCLTRNPLSS